MEMKKIMKSTTKNYNNKSHRVFGGGTRGRSVGDICVVVVMVVNSSNWKAKAKAQSSTQLFNISKTISRGSNFTKTDREGRNLQANELSTDTQRLASETNTKAASSSIWNYSQ